MDRAAALDPGIRIWCDAASLHMWMCAWRMSAPLCARLESRLPPPSGRLDCVFVPCLLGAWLSSFLPLAMLAKDHLRWRPYRVEYTGSLLTSEVKRHRAWLVLGWGTAREHPQVLSAFSIHPLRSEDGMMHVRCFELRVGRRSKRREVDLVGRRSTVCEV